MLIKISRKYLYVFFVLLSLAGCDLVPLDPRFITKPGEIPFYFHDTSNYIRNGIVVKSIFDTVRFDTAKNNLDAISKCISGIKSGNSGLDNLEKNYFWQNYKIQTDNSWSYLFKNRLNKMDTWFKQEFRNKIKDSILLFYPFSGPDYMHSGIFYPNAKVYLFAAIEEAGDIPDIDKMNVAQSSDYIRQLNSALRNAYDQSYFITLNMMKDLRKGKVSGVIPIFMLFISRLQGEIKDIKKVYMLKDGFLTSVNTPHSVNGVRIVFEDNRTKSEKILYYFKCDISNSGLKKNPQFLEFIKFFREFNTYVKSASYLMHSSEFSNIRSFILDNTSSILQDDTGIPFKYFNKEKWSINLFGTYVRPLNVFRLQEEKELATEYSKKGNVKPLPFNLGYHWHNNKQCQMMYIRKNQ